MSSPNFPDGPYTNLNALKDTLNDKDVRKKIKRIFILGGVAFVASTAYLIHRDRINALHLGHQAAAAGTMWSSFDEGTRYGLALAKDPSIAGFGAKEISQYAFGAFDKPA